MTLSAVPPVVICVWGLVVSLEIIKNARRTHYLLTNERALTVVEGKKKVQSVSCAEFEVERRDLKRGKADVILKRKGRRAMFPEVGFFGIANAREVEEMASRLERMAR